MQRPIVYILTNPFIGRTAKSVRAPLSRRDLTSLCRRHSPTAQSDPGAFRRQILTSGSHINVLYNWWIGFLTDINSKDPKLDKPLVNVSLEKAEKFPGLFNFHTDDGLWQVTWSF